MDWSTGTTLLTMRPPENVRRVSVWSEGPVGSLKPTPTETLPFLQESGSRTQRRAVSEESLIAFEWVTERSITTRLASRIGFDREAMKYGTLALMLVRWLRL